MDRSDGFWKRPQVVFSADYERRRLAVEEGVGKLSFGAVTRLAKAVGQSRQYVSGVIHGSEWSPETLMRLEAKLFTKKEAQAA